MHANKFRKKLLQDKKERIKFIQDKCFSTTKLIIKAYLSKK